MVSEYTDPRVLGRHMFFLILFLEPQFLYAYPIHPRIQETSVSNNIDSISCLFIYCLPSLMFKAFFSCTNDVPFHNYKSSYSLFICLKRLSFNNL